MEVGLKKRKKNQLSWTNIQVYPFYFAFFCFCHDYIRFDRIAFYIGNVKQVVLPQPTDPVYVDLPNQAQYYAAEDIASNSSVGRPFFYQVYALPCFLYEYYFIIANMFFFAT
jgi:hypothetical protein